MALDLPAPQTAPLLRSPLSLVVCQVKHEHTTTASEPSLAFRMREEMKDHYPILEEQATQDVLVSVGPFGAPSVPGPTLRGWKLRSSDEAWRVALMPDSFSLETTAYVDWPDYRARLARLAELVGSHVRPSLEQRVGLRFIDRIKHEAIGRPSDFVGWIDEHFLGAVSHDVVGPAATGAQQMLQLDAGDDTYVTIRHGIVRDPADSGRVSYLFDEDCFMQRGHTFSADTLMEALDRLHVLALQIFQLAITDRLYAYLKGGGG